ncbi:MULTISPECIES: methyltransferase domain-containing protein [unclassified Methanoregula]|uniref:methyltransferase domain-containing protein n=1 Tax=unclassified Methanoregula TaxID=2649730 RepID=UPI0009CDE007|nr:MULTISPECIES: methyltransferase domain-containing protein [unclassified Methanoregula]OPX65538.1 MAG: tRNA (adenine(57)-N(1)/adenine(58)-N(1))-methyltransferase TrmI [Methanoregula sp. PtaB.Bin085]OPY35818.1 MAG: tRNA (adenine(57)-N(1)/adenine(58)-N(1))-methyltransferase TrmI [Methanoregula sp. PtaU1.Bin006]
MIEAGDRVLLAGEGREFWVRAGPGKLGTDKGEIDLASLVGKSGGDIVATHSGAEFTIRIPRPTDFFTWGKRSGAPMLPKDIGLVIAYTGMNHNDEVLDAGTGSGIAAIYFGGVARSVKTFEIRPEFSALALKNIKEAKLENVEAVAKDFLDAEGTFDVVHLDMQIEPRHVEHAFSLLRSGGYLACYTPFLEQMAIVVDAATPLFREVHTHELIEREMTRSKRGTRPSTSVSHSGYVTIARK